MNTFLISDLHLGHKNAVNWRTEYATEEDMYQDLKEKWHSVVKFKHDCVYILGDACLSLERLVQFSEWTGNKTLIVGNHDTERVNIGLLNHYFKGQIHSLIKYKEFWLSHAPIHPDELRGKRNIHGHTHSHVIADNNYINVCVEQLNGVPHTLEQLRLKHPSHLGENYVKN